MRMQRESRWSSISPPTRCNCKSGIMAADSNRQAGRFPKGVISAYSALGKESHPCPECFRLAARPERAPGCLRRFQLTVPIAPKLQESLRIAVLRTQCGHDDE